MAKVTYRHVAKVTYRHVEEDGHFTFHLAGGKAVTVTAKGHTTGDPAEIAVLDNVPFVKRASTKPSGEEA